MIASTKHGTRSLAALVVILSLTVAVAVLAGCGSKEKAAPAAEQKATGESSSQVQSMPQGESQAPQTAVDWTGYSNPKQGICPVCAMTLNPQYIEVATIGENKYACCSSMCATKLAANPDQYLKADAQAEGSHEGHAH